MLSFIFFLSVLHLLISATAMGGESAAYTPTENILLNCGSSSSSSSGDDRGWVPDERSKFSAFNADNISFVSTASRQDHSTPQVPYMTARVFHDKFTYSFQVSPGLKFLRFYFYPVQYSDFDAAASFFSVVANDYLLLHNFSASFTVSTNDAATPGTAALVKEFMVPVSETGKLNVTFLPPPNYLAFVNGIEVVSMPSNMYRNQQQNTSTFVNANSAIAITDVTAFETVYRLNIGGPTVPTIDDTGMFRKWSDDWAYIFGAATGFIQIQSNMTVKYTEDTPAYTAPAIVYSTSRTMGDGRRINMNYNLTWNFNIDTGFNYLLRLHFCEPRVMEAGQCVFEIFIDNHTVEIDADVILWSGGNSIAVFRDYVWSIPSEGQSKHILWLALHPREDVNLVFADAVLNGLEIFRLNKSDGSLAVPNPKPSTSLKPPVPDNIHPTKGKKNMLPLKTTIGAALGCTAIVSISLVLSLIFWRNKRHSYANRKSVERRKVSQFANQLCKCFTFEEIQAATNYFDDAFVVGRGGFGNVYKGFIKEIKCEVAIKRLNSTSHQGAQEFWTEIQLLSQLRHIHLVSLIGYCSDSNEMILVYEYMANGTLRDHIYDTENSPLSWEQRLNICIGAACGLRYLHSEATRRVIHRDVKSTNILLDEKYVAKVSDFGLCKISSISRSNVPLTTMVKGTFGYMDPEYYRRLQLTEKSDVYSFGVVLFEVLFGRPAVDSNLEYSQISLADWGRKCVENGSIDETIDPFLKGKVSAICLRTYADIAENCIRKNGDERPSMNDVAQRLEFVLRLQETEDSEQTSVASDGAESNAIQDI